MSDYNKSLEEENIKLRKLLTESYLKRSWSKAPDLDENFDCHTAGLLGNCGSNCPVFRSGKCEVADEILEHMEDDVKEIKEVYETKKD